MLGVAVVQGRSEQGPELVSAHPWNKKAFAARKCQNFLFSLPDPQASVEDTGTIPSKPSALKRHLNGCFSCLLPFDEISFLTWA